MNRQIRRPQPPTFQGAMKSRTIKGPNYKDMIQAVRTVNQFLPVFIEYLVSYLSSVADQVNSQVQGVGSALASAPTIVLDHAIHHVTGVATISTITPPAGFSGPVFLIPDGAWSTNTAGNIARAVTATVNQVIIFTYDLVTAKWYPNI